MKNFYCPFCGNKIEVAEIDTNITSCECPNCGKMMLESYEVKG